MDVDLRFDEKSRGMRVTLACVTVLLVWLLVPVMLTGVLLANILVQPWRITKTIEAYLTGWIAILWYSGEAFRINWKD